MIDYIRLQEMLILHEGIELKPYLDTVGKWTIGVGHNLSDKGITRNEAMFLLQNDIDDVVEDLADMEFYQKCNDARKLVLIDMAFNMGTAGLLKFGKMIDAIHRDNYKLAAEEQLDSLWATQVGRRATELAEMMRAGR